MVQCQLLIVNHLQTTSASISLFKKYLILVLLTVLLLMYLQLLLLLLLNLHAIHYLILTLVLFSLY